MTKVQKTTHPGFALVATLALMVLLAILAVGLLSLSAVTLRSSGQGAAQAEARANARMALMIAIGELQSYTGADTRVTAPADLLDPNAPPLTGVWKSWEGTNHDSTGCPIKPDYSVKNPGSGGDRFVTWLVSGAMENGVPTPAAPAELVSESSEPGNVPLLGAGTLGDNNGQVHVKPLPVMNGKGRLAWWVSPENQKARLMQPHKPRTDDIAGWIEMGQSHLVPNPEVFGFDKLIEDPENYTPDPNSPKAAGKAITLATSEFIANDNAAKPHNSFHNLSTSAVGLLTNTATGGWRKDLSLLTEKWDSIYSGYQSGMLPLFRYRPASGATSMVPKPTTSKYDPEQSNLYPWSNYSVILGERRPTTLHAASASWQSLQSFATSYKKFSYSGGEVESPFIWNAISKSKFGGVIHTNQEFYDYLHIQRMYPQIARFQFLVYARAVERIPVQNPKKYDLKLLYVPVFTLWNPYNVRLTIETAGAPKDAVVLGFRRALPGALAIVPQSTYPNPDMVPGTEYKLLWKGNVQFLDVNGNFNSEQDVNLEENIKRFKLRSATEVDNWLGGVASNTLGGNLPKGKIAFEPGEVMMFSPDGRVDSRFGGAKAFGLEKGYSPAEVEGLEVPVASNLAANQSYWFLLRTDSFTRPFRNRAAGVGFSLSYGIATGASYVTGSELYPSLADEYHNITSITDGVRAEDYWPQSEVDEIGYSIAELASGPWIPLFSINQGPRMTIGNPPGTVQNRPAKGVLQSDPLASIMIIDPAWNDAKGHPVNGTTDMSYHSLSLGSTITPNLSDSKGFIATGYQSGDGISRLITHEIPARPMASLVELQSWNPRGHNPYPPFQSNLIGNSDATPMIPKDQVIPPTLVPSSVALNLMHDDTYCSNHLLFDDWFVSSIAPKPQTLGGNIAKDIETRYGDFLKGNEPLSNRSYRTIAEDNSLTDSQVADQVQKIVNSPDGWLKAASRLEVDGMFNVNSTSIAAWTALLGHAKSREEIAIHGKDEMESVAVHKKHPVSRGAVASDVEAGNSPAHGGLAEKTAEYTGFRSLTDKQIEDLAKKIVDQVQARGPFLSLAEFVNRQLSADGDLALAGAVQTAINNMEDDPMKVLRNPKNSLADDTMAVKAKTEQRYKDMLGGVGYEFPEASEGSSAYGVPGWIRQADVLRPLAPILSARDDTFTIRAYGDSTDANGNILAKAWCEAVVRRTRDFCDLSDAADSIEPPVSPTNIKFGRRYQIVTFRWLNKDEV